MHVHCMSMKILQVRHMEAVQTVQHSAAGEIKLLSKLHLTTHYFYVLIVCCPIIHWDLYMGFVQCLIAYQ